MTELAGTSGDPDLRRIARRLRTAERQLSDDKRRLYRALIDWESTRPVPTAAFQAVGRQRAHVAALRSDVAAVKTQARARTVLLEGLDIVTRGLAELERSLRANSDTAAVDHGEKARKLLGRGEVRVDAAREMLP
jgi:catechol-2,3-dioxygenase